MKTSTGIILALGLWVLFMISVLGMTLGIDADPLKLHYFYAFLIFLGVSYIIFEAVYIYVGEPITGVFDVTYHNVTFKNFLEGNVYILGIATVSAFFFTGLYRASRNITKIDLSVDIPRILDALSTLGHRCYEFLIACKLVLLIVGIILGLILIKYMLYLIFKKNGGKGKQ